MFFLLFLSSVILMNLPKIGLCIGMQKAKPTSSNINPNPNGWQSCGCKNLTENIYKSATTGRHNFCSQSSIGEAKLDAGIGLWIAFRPCWEQYWLKGKSPVSRPRWAKHAAPSCRNTSSKLQQPGTSHFPLQWTPHKLHHWQLGCCSINGMESKLLQKACGPYVTAPTIKAYMICL